MDVRHCGRSECVGASQHTAAPWASSIPLATPDHRLAARLDPDYTSVANSRLSSGPCADVSARYALHRPGHGTAHPERALVWRAVLDEHVQLAIRRRSGQPVFGYLRGSALAPSARSSDPITAVPSAVDTEGRACRAVLESWTYEDIGTADDICSRHTERHALLILRRKLSCPSETRRSRIVAKYQEHVGDWR